MVNRTTPPTIDVLTGVQAVAAGYWHTCALMTTGGVRCWGDNAYGVGQLGDGTGVSSTNLPTADVLTDVKAIAARGMHTCVLMTSGGVRCWGDNMDGQLGDGTTTDRSTPPTTDAITDVNAIATGQFHTCALTVTGGVRCWGDNGNGELGYDPILGSKLAPTRTDILSNVQDIAAGFSHNCAVMTSGNLRCWGMNDTGQLGDGTTSDNSTPTPVVGFCN